MFNHIQMVRRKLKKIDNIAYSIIYIYTLFIENIKFKLNFSIINCYICNINIFIVLINVVNYSIVLTEKFIPTRQ